jgi:hypothetical protein
MDRVTPGRHDAPVPRHVRLPPWPGMIAHTRASDDRLYVQASPVFGPDDPVDLRCPACTAGSEIGLDHEYQVLVFMIHHAPGCKAVKRLLAGAR